MSDNFISTNGMDIPEKHKAIYLHIVVCNDITNPYYTIHWDDPDLKQIVAGYGSYDLKLVYDWLHSKFEIINPSPDYLIAQLSKKVEAYKECIEKVKEELKNIAKIEWQDNYYYLVGTAFFDNLLEEMAGKYNVE